MGGDLGGDPGAIGGVGIHSLIQRHPRFAEHVGALVAQHALAFAIPQAEAAVGVEPIDHHRQVVKQRREVVGRPLAGRAKHVQGSHGGEALGLVWWLGSIHGIGRASLAHVRCC